MWTRILAFAAALLSGLIFVLGSLRAQFFGESFAQYLIIYFGMEATLAQTFDILMKIVNFAGWIILAAAVLILIKRVRIAKIILFIVIGTGLISFFIPVIAALAQGTLTVEVLLNGDATMYLVATLFGIIAKLYTDKLT
ncbi:MAG: hypothetical protein HWN66_05660 [Candidatus Helarchaeota archaeon]|nr:hypothetical protein [Candidatus Helarchaeota archaeon]